MLTERPDWLQSEPTGTSVKSAQSDSVRGDYPGGDLRREFESEDFQQLDRADARRSSDHVA
jgi:hypothetical protein